MTNVVLVVLIIAAVVFGKRAGGYLPMSGQRVYPRKYGLRIFGLLNVNALRANRGTLIHEITCTGFDRSEPPPSNKRRCFAVASRPNICSPGKHFHLRSRGADQNVALSRCCQLQTKRSDCSGLIQNFYRAICLKGQAMVAPLFATENTPTIILLVEDSPGDIRLTLEAFGEANPSVRLYVATDGVEAMASLRHEGA